MNDLDFGGDLRAALDRDADLVGEPAADLLDQLLRRRAHQRRQRTALMGAVAAMVVIAAGIPIGVSLAASSAPAPATQPIAPTPSVTQHVVPPTPPAESASPATTTPPAVAARTTTSDPTTSRATGATTGASVVSSWVRQTYHGLSFVVPVANVTPSIQDSSDPSGDSVYSWNYPAGDTAPPADPPVDISVHVAPVQPIAGQEPSDLSRPITVPGAATATYQSGTVQYSAGPRTQVYVTMKTASTFYSVRLEVPDDPDGAHLADQFVAALNIP